MPESDLQEIRNRFAEAYGQPDPTNHPLFQQMEMDLRTNRRSKAAILADIGDAHRHRVAAVDSRRRATRGGW